jgi:hypothetical protein
VRLNIPLKQNIPKNNREGINTIIFSSWLFKKVAIKTKGRILSNAILQPWIIYIPFIMKKTYCDCLSFFEDTYDLLVGMDPSQYMLF